MNKTQKAAWYGILLSLLLSSVFLIDMFEGKMGPVVTHLIGYLVLLPLLLVPVYYLQKKKTASEFDERDKSIVVKGVIVSFVTLSAILLLGYAVVIMGFAGISSFPVTLLPELVYSSFIVYILVLSLWILIQYHLGHT